MINEHGEELVTLPVVALRELVRRSDIYELFVNLPRRGDGSWQRVLRLRFRLLDPQDPTLELIEEEDGRRVRTAEVRTSVVFDMLPLVVGLLRDSYDAPAPEFVPCAFCADLDGDELPDGTQAESAREYRATTGHWPSCPTQKPRDPSARTRCTD